MSVAGSMTVSNDSMLRRFLCQAEDGIRVAQESRGLGDVYKRQVPRYGFDVDFQVESYLHYQGQSFVERFDANTYLYLGRVMDYFDPFADPVRTIEQIGSGETNFLILSFDSDWRFSTGHARDMARELRLAGGPVTFREISSPHGHDSFLFADPEYHQTCLLYPSPSPRAS